MHDTLVLGIGNPLLGDDRAGIEVAERIAAANAPADAEALFSVGFEVLDRLQGYCRAFVVDACNLGLAPGTIVEATAEEVLSSPRLSHSHAVTLGATLTMGFRLIPEDMPEELSLYFIEAEAVGEFSDRCAPAVAAAVEEVARRILARLGGRQAGRAEPRERPSP